MSIGKIEWVKWEDPFCVGRPGDEDDNGSEEGEVRVVRSAAMVGPSGFLGFHEKGLVSRYYNFWVGHVDFRLNIGDVKKIKRVNGVESLNIATRHRFRIAIGKAFDEGDVMGNISRLFLKPQEKGGRTAIQILGDSLSQKWKYWAIVKGEGGRLSPICSDRRDDVSVKLVNLIGNQEVVRSWD